MSFFQKRFIQDKPTDAQESGQMYINFKKYATERFPDGITDEQWKEIEVHLYRMLLQSRHNYYLDRMTVNLRKRRRKTKIEQTNTCNSHSIILWGNY